jgi:hypothetical protein
VCSPNPHGKQVHHAQRHPPVDPQAHRSLTIARQPAHAPCSAGNFRLSFRPERGGLCLAQWRNPCPKGKRSRLWLRHKDFSAARSYVALRSK